ADKADTDDGNHMPFSGKDRGKDQNSYLDDCTEHGCAALQTDIAQNVRVHITCHTGTKSLNAVDGERVDNQSKERAVFRENTPDVFDVQLGLFIILLCLLLCAGIALYCQHVMC